MNRILGTLFALATLAAIAFAILNSGTYTSICFTPAEDPAPADTLDMVDTLDPEDTFATPDTPLTDDADIAPIDAPIDATVE